MKSRMPFFAKSLIAFAVASVLSMCGAMARDHGSSSKVFNRIATFPVYLNTDIDAETVAEIVDASKDGKVLIYTDGTAGKIGFVDIKNPAKPKPRGAIAVSGEPTSVAVAGDYALAAVNTSSDFVNTSGKLLVIDIKNHKIVANFDLGGQPDSVAVSPNEKYAAIVIENERDEDLGDGAPPQMPSGYLVIVDLVGEPTEWTLRKVNLEGIADLYPEDAEPEYVDINAFNIAAVTFQENNHIALIHLPTGRVINDFSAGTADLNLIDTKENDLIELNNGLTDVPREPDGIAWIGPFAFATADEGDLNGGSRSFTIFGATGNIRYTSGNTLEHVVVRLGHYPENRSENKGNEPENVEYAVYGKDRYLFVASERSSVVFVYKMRGLGLRPELVQVLPAGVGPEGIKAIPRRNLFVSASENDARGDGIRSGITIYMLEDGNADYPTVVSANRSDGTPIPWGALSGLAVDADGTVYTIHDSFYQQSRIYAMDVSRKPAVITREIVLKDSNSMLTMIAPQMVNGIDGDYGTVNLDQEGIATREDSGFWIVSEGAGSVDDPSRPVTTKNLLLQVSNDADIEKVVSLPEEVNERQRRFGFEGVALTGSAANNDEMVYVAFQRQWKGDKANHVRIGRYRVATGDWTFFYYPLDTVESPNGGWIGLSEITSLGNDEFAVIERDNQANTDARIKRIYKFSVAGLTPKAEQSGEPVFPVVNKILVHDLMPDLEATGGLVLEKIEGMTVLADGTTLVVNDNDGVDGSNGETQLIALENLFDNKKK